MYMGRYPNANKCQNFEYLKNGDSKRKSFVNKDMWETFNEPWLPLLAFLGL